MEILHALESTLEKARVCYQVITGLEMEPSFREEDYSVSEDSIRIINSISQALDVILTFSAKSKERNSSPKVFDASRSCSPDSQSKKPEARFKSAKPRVNKNMASRASTGPQAHRSLGTNSVSGQHPIQQTELTGSLYLNSIRQADTAKFSSVDVINYEICDVANLTEETLGQECSTDLLILAPQHEVSGETSRGLQNQYRDLDEVTTVQGDDFPVQRVLQTKCQGKYQPGSSDIPTSESGSIIKDGQPPMSQEYLGLEKLVQRYEAEIRSHIRIEQTMKVYSDNLQSKLESALDQLSVSDTQIKVGSSSARISLLR